MPIPLILAMDGCEFPRYRNDTQRIAWMTDQFPPANGWISKLPPNAMIVLTDQHPIADCDPKQAAAQLAGLQPGRVLLDFQRSGDPKNRHFAVTLVDALPCPVGVSAEYAKGLPCPVFLPPVPPNILPQEYLKPWIDQEIWLEVALDACEITVTAGGTNTIAYPFAQASEHAHRDDTLHCHYTIRQVQDAVLFYLYRSREDTLSLLEGNNMPNVTLAVGLFQELG